MDSRVEGRWIYVSMMCGDVVEVVFVCGRRIRIFWFTFKEINGRLHNVNGNFCSIWQVSCAPMSRSTRVSARNFRNADVAGSAMAESRTILRSMSWKLSDFFSALDAYLAIYFCTACMESTGWQSTFARQIDRMVGLWLLSRSSFRAGVYVFWPLESMNKADFGCNSHGAL